MNKIKIINLPEITVADNTTYIPVSTGVTNATRKISAGNLAGFDNVSYLPQLKTTMEMSQARENIGAVRKSFAEIEDHLSVLYSADPLDPNGDEVFKIENSNSTDGPDVTVNDWGYMYLRKGIYLAAGADIEGVTSADLFNLKDITSPVQAQLDSKASANNPTFTGVTNFEGDVQVSEDIIVDGNVRSYSNTVDTRLQFGQGAKIKIQTGVNGGTPVYREFPATELSSSDLNGTSYVMVYGVGTPEENAVELQTAYNEAKNMPRYIGSISLGDASKIYYKGQTYYQTEYAVYRRMLSTVTSFGNGSVVNNAYSEVITETEAKSTRTTVVVAPGEYDFGAAAFVADAPGINIVSLTGNSDVIISSTQENTDTGYTYGIKVTVDDIFIKGIDCKINLFYIANNLDNLICEYCIGGDNSFGGLDGNASGTFNYCTGGDGSFGGYGGTASGTFKDCKGGIVSFGVEGTLTGELINCKLIEGTFQTPTEEGKIYNCIDGNGALVNYPPLFETKTSQVVNGLTEVVDTSKDIIIYKNNDVLTLPSAASLANKRITIKNNFTIDGQATMEFINSIIGAPTNRTIQKKFGCPNLDTFIVVGSIIVVGDNNTEMSVDSVHADFITVTKDMPTDVYIGSVIIPDTPITIGSNEFTNGRTYELIYENESKDFYSNGVNWYAI